MATARAARDAGAVAIQLVPFVDLVTGKDREVDVVAEFEESAGPPCPVTLVIECKRAPGKHWVTFPYDAGKISSEPVRDHALVDPSNFVRAGRLQRAWADGPTIFGPEPSIGFGLTEADLSRRAGERNKDEDGGDLAAKALRQVWSAARALLVNEELPRMSGGDKDAPITRIIVPVIVTGAALWECRIGADGEPAVRQVDYARVRTPSTANAVLVHVMGLEHFRSFARQVADLQTRNDPAWGPGHTPSWRDLPRVRRSDSQPGTARACRR
jgi:hypothetical protein